MLDRSIAREPVHALPLAPVLTKDHAGTAERGDLEYGHPAGAQHEIGFHQDIRHVLNVFQDVRTV